MAIDETQQVLKPPQARYQATGVPWGSCTAAANDTEPASLDAALADWNDGDLGSALVNLGAIVDHGDRDVLIGGLGDDELIRGRRDFLIQKSWR